MENLKSNGNDYALKTGHPAAERLRLQDKMYGASTRGMMLERGLGAGMRVLDLACGTGTVSHWLVKQVGRSGCVVGVDISPDQLTYARSQGQSDGLGCPEFVEGSAYETGLDSASFDLVHCRLLLAHLERPGDALREMYRVLKPGGVLVCQDMEVSSVYSCPHSTAYEQSVALAHATGKLLGVNYDFGRQLHTAVMDAGFTQPSVSFTQPAYVSGPQKWWWHQVFSEAVPAMIRFGVAREAELSTVVSELERLVRDESVLLAHARFPAVAAVK